MRTVWVKEDVSKHFSRLIKKKSGGGEWSPRIRGWAEKFPRRGGENFVFLDVAERARERGENFVFKKMRSGYCIL